MMSGAGGHLELHHDGAMTRFEEALTLWRGTPELPDSHRGISEKTRWIEGHAALVEDRADALLATGRAAEIIGKLEAAVADAPLRERRWGQLMLALYRAGRQGEALGAYQRARPRAMYGMHRDEFCHLPKDPSL
jgi:DNA-binding SARP family transcriptional activator